MWGYPVNTKHLYNICIVWDQRRKRWADVAQMLYKCIAFAGYKACVTFIKVSITYSSV